MKYLSLSLSISQEPAIQSQLVDQVPSGYHVATKPTAVALRLLDKLFKTPTLMCSMVNGTKEFVALDPSKITVIKSKGPS